MRGLFDWWRVRRCLCRPIVSAELSAGIAILGLVLAFVAGVATAILTGIVGVLALIYVIDRVSRRLAMRYGPPPDEDIRTDDFTAVPRALTPEYRFSAPSGPSRAQLYPYVDISHESPSIRKANDISREGRLALYQRWYGACPHGFLHLEKRVGSQWRPIAISIILPLSVEGLKAITCADRERAIRVIDLDRGGIRDRLDGRHPTLLIDTWIVDREYAGAGHGKSRASGGFANALVLGHIALFWTPRKRSAIKFVVETNNRRLIPMLRGLAFLPSGRSKIAAGWFTVDSKWLRAAAPAEFKQVSEALAALASVAIVDGSAPQPTDWSGPTR